MPDMPPTSSGRPRRKGFWWRSAKPIFAAAGAIVVIAAGLLLHTYTLGHELTNLSYDLPFLFRGPRAAATEDVRIIYIDLLTAGRRKELVDVGKEPALSRRVYAQLIRKLKEAGAKMIVIDVFFDQPSEQRQGDAGDDDDLAAAMAEHGNVILAAGLTRDVGLGETTERIIAPEGKKLRPAAADWGLAKVPQDFQRRLDAGYEERDSMTWVAARRLGARLPAEHGADFTEGWINYYGEPNTVKGVGYEKVLDQGWWGSFARDKVVFIGGRFTGVGDARGKDQFPTPWSHFRRAVPGGEREVPLMDGVEVHANVFLNLIRGEWLLRLRAGYETAVLVLCGALFGGALCGLRPGRAVADTFIFVLLVAFSGAALAWWGGHWFAWLIPAGVQAPLGLGWALVSWYYVEHRKTRELEEEQRKLSEAIGSLVSPKMLDQLKQNNFEIGLGGVRKEVAIMFTDLEGFTDMSEKLREHPEKIVSVLTDYFERTTEPILNRDGVILKFIGDAVFAAWGVFTQDAGMAEKAADAAIELFKHAKVEVEGVEHRTRMGLHVGEVVAGNLGGKRRFDYTLIGDAVNLAQRLESANKQLGTSVLLTGEMERRLRPLGRFRIRRVGLFHVKGRGNVTVEFHELIGIAQTPETPAWMAGYDEALKEFEHGDLSRAMMLFKQMGQKRKGGDPPSEFFVRYISELDPDRPDTLRPRVVELREK